MKRTRLSDPRIQSPKALDAAQLADIKGGASMVEYALLLVGSTTPTK